MTFKLSQYFEIKEIQIGFINFWTVNTEVYIEPSSVLIEAGLTEDEMTQICSLDKIQDKGFANFGSTVYGKNMFSFTPDFSEPGTAQEVIQKSLRSLTNVRARYLRFKMWNDVVTCVDNSPLVAKFNKPKALGINFISIMGYNVSNLGSLKNTLLEK